MAHDGIQLDSDLWLDQPEGIERIGQHLDRGLLDAQEAEGLRQFCGSGHVRFRLADAEALSDELMADVDRLWSERPADVAYRFTSEPASLADARERHERMAPCALLNLHGHSEAALGLYLHPEVFRWVELILERKAVAFESIFVEFGRSETPYRDLVYLEMSPASHLLTAWIALEDIEMKAGPPFVVPGSHRLPLYEFGPGRFSIRPGEDYLPARRFAAARAGDAGLSEEDLTLRKGEVVLWHPALVHGARRILEPWVTRRSLLVRFTSLGALSTWKASFWKTVRGRLWRREQRLYWRETDRLLERDGCAGFDDPLKGMNPRGLSVWEKIRNKLGRSED